MAWWGNQYGSNNHIIKDIQSCLDLWIIRHAKWSGIPVLQSQPLLWVLWCHLRQLSAEVFQGFLKWEGLNQGSPTLRLQSTTGPWALWNQLQKWGESAVVHPTCTSSSKFRCAHCYLCKWSKWSMCVLGCCSCESIPFPFPSWSTKTERKLWITTCFAKVKVSSPGLQHRPECTPETWTENDFL